MLSRCCTWKWKHPLEVASEIRLIHKGWIQILFWNVIIIHWSISFSQTAHSTVHHTGRAQAQASPEDRLDSMSDEVIWGQDCQERTFENLLGTVWNWGFSEFGVTWLISPTDKGWRSAIVPRKICWPSFYQICNDWCFRKWGKNFIIRRRYQIVLLKLVIITSVLLIFMTHIMVICHMVICAMESLPVFTWRT